MDGGPQKKKKKTYLIKFEILYFFTNRYKNKNFLIFCKYARIFENLIFNNSKHFFFVFSKVEWNSKC